MITRKEFQELMQEMEEKAPPIIFNENLEISYRFIPLAIERIKRLERALEISIKCLEEYKKDGFGEYGCGCCADQVGGDGATVTLEQIKKELGE